MNNIKAFATHQSFITNTPGQVSVIGELSPQSRTFSREVGVYSVSNSPVVINTFLCVKDGGKVSLQPDAVTHMVNIINAIFQLTISSALQPQPSDIAKKLTTDFGNVASNIQMGEIVTDGTHYVPEWIQWQCTASNSLDINNTIKIWLADASFQKEYDEYEIVIVPPISNIDDFFGVYASVKELMAAVTLPVMMQKINAAKNGQPESYIQTSMFSWYDPLNKNNTIPTPWTAIVYGASGINIDAINDAFKDYILSNSTHTQADWIKIMPDIFKRTEFTFIPFWYNRAVQAVSGLSTPLYSPVVTVSNAMAFLHQVVTGYPDAHINTNAQVLSNPYKSVTLGSVSSPDNRNNWMKITDVYPDYLSIMSGTDFGRMSRKTQNMAVVLNTLVQLAETADQYSTLPSGYSRVRRNNLLYLTATVDDINFLVAAKSTLPAPI